jgi:hypothetical protein
MKRSEVICCPFYRKRFPREIICEGLKEANIKLTFKTDQETLDYFSKKCATVSGCASCLIHQALWLKYGG